MVVWPGVLLASEGQQRGILGCRQAGGRQMEFADVENYGLSGVDSKSKHPYTLETCDYDPT